MDSLARAFPAPIHNTVDKHQHYILLLFRIMPESFRWLVAHGRLDEAEKTIAYVARVNRKPVPNMKKIRAAFGE